jgi:hypothetical protein
VKDHLVAFGFTKAQVAAAFSIDGAQRRRATRAGLP